jgi:hypothetical protein
MQSSCNLSAKRPSCRAKSPSCRTGRPPGSRARRAGVSRYVRRRLMLVSGSDHAPVIRRRLYRLLPLAFRAARPQMAICFARYPGAPQTRSRTTSSPALIRRRTLRPRNRQGGWQTCAAGSQRAVSSSRRSITDSRVGPWVPCGFSAGHGKTPDAERVFVDNYHCPCVEILGDLAEVGEDDRCLLCGPASDQPADEDH